MAPRTESDGFLGFARQCAVFLAESGSGMRLETPEEQIARVESSGDISAAAEMRIHWKLMKPTRSAVQEQVTT